MEVHQCRGPQSLEYLSGYEVNWLDAPICRSCLAVIGENLRKTAEEHNGKDSLVERWRIKIPQLQPTIGIHI